MQKNKITCQTCLDLDLESSCIVRRAYIVVTAGELTLWCGQIRAYVYKMATNQIRCMHKNISAALIFYQFPVSNLACVLNLSKTNFLPILQ